MGTFVMGDIHGSYKGLLQCLERSGFDKETDTLIQLGDVADGWSQVPQCVEELLTIKNLIPIMGNHDEWAYQWLKFCTPQPMWLQQGGQATHDAYVNFYPDLMIKHEEFFAKQHLYYIDSQNRGFVHGGFQHPEGLGNERASSYLWDRELWKSAVASHAIHERTLKNGNKPNNIPVCLRQHTEIFVGHTTTMNWKTDQPMQAHNMWNLDTGAGFKGRLTIMDVETKEYWQSDPSEELYPNDIGR